MLLHSIRDFDPELDQLPVEHTHFRAGRPMRDVEAGHRSSSSRTFAEWGN